MRNRYWILFGLVVVLAMIQIARPKRPPMQLDENGRFIDGGAVEIAWETDPDAVFGDTGRPVLALFTADWCGPCQVLKAEALADDTVRQAIVEKFTPLYVDLTRSGGSPAEFARQHDVRSVPTLMVLRAEGTELARRSGIVDRDTLLKWLAMTDLSDDLGATRTSSLVLR